MKWFYDLKISTKLISTFILVSILAGIVGAVGITNIKNIDKKYSSLFIGFGVAQGDIGQLGITFNDARSVTRDVLFLKDTNKRSQNIDKIKESDKKMTQQLNVIEKSLATDEGRATFKNLSDAIEKYDIVRDKVINLAIANQLEQAEELFYSEAAQPAKDVDENNK